MGISGEALGLPQLPDSEFLKPMELTCVEEHLKKSLSENYDDRLLTIGRTAHVTEGTKPGDGRVNCQLRNRCARGCPFGAYFSSLSSTLPMAEATGNMTLRPNSIVSEVLYDKDSKKATGVRVVDHETKDVIDFKAKVIFLCASTVGSTSILMQSRSEVFPEGMGNESGELGHNIMDHHLGVGASASIEGFEDKYYIGRRPNGIYIPRFRNIGGKTNQKDFLRGYGYQGGGSRGSNWYDSVKELASYGPEFKESVLNPGSWTFGIGGFCEILPYHDNKMSLDYNKLDSWGLPTVTFDASIRENELNMRKDMKQQAVEMLEKAGYKIEPAFGSEDSTVVIEVPVDVGEGVRTLSQVPMWEQLSLAAFMQKYWADNQVSCTVTFDPETEGPQIPYALNYFQYQMKGVSFLPKLELGAYKQMPYEAIDEEEYNKQVKKLGKLSFGVIKNEEADIDKFCNNDS